MEKFKVSFEANNQQLKSIGTKHASDTYADIEATFVLGEKWTDMDSVSAVWWNDFTRIATVLDSQGKCVVPHEVLTRKGCVRVNLVGSIVEGDELITRLTSYSAEAVQVNEKIKLTGNEPQSITPSQYEQFVQNVKADADRAEAGATESEQSAQNASESASASAVSASDSARSATASAGYAQDASEIAVEVEVMKNEVELAKDKVLGMRATAETLEAGSDATASYSDGLLTLGIPRGDQGEQGIQGVQGETGATPSFSIGTVETLEPTEDATATITGTAENPVLNLGLPKGDTGEVSLEDLEALLPTETASGDIVTIPDGQSVIPAESLKVTLEPIQSGSGTPSPDNVRPISGRTEVVTHRTGKNLLAKPFSFRKDDATIADAFPIKSGTYTFSFASIVTATKWQFGVSLFDADGNALKTNEYEPNSNMSFLASINMWWYGVDSTARSLSLNIAEDCYIRIWFASGDTTSAMESVDAQLELGSTATDYEPYQGNTYTTALGQTVYGGTLDVVSGEMVVDRAYVDLGTLTYTYNASSLIGVPCFYATIPSIKAGSNKNLSSAFENKLDRTYINGSGQMAIGNTTSANYIVFRDDEFTDATAFKTAMNGVQLCYELASPQTIQLTPQEVQLLHGTNNIWSDGKVTLTYSADIQKYIEKKLQS